MVPSAEEAMDCQPLLGAAFVFQVNPEFVDVYMGPVNATAANLLPSAEDAT